MYKEKDSHLDTTQLQSKLSFTESSRFPSSRVSEHLENYPFENKKTRFTKQLKTLKQNIGSLTNLIEQKKRTTRESIYQVYETNRSLKTYTEYISHKNYVSSQQEQLVLPLTHQAKQNISNPPKSPIFYHQHENRVISKKIKPFQQLIDNQSQLSPCFKNQNQKESPLKQSYLYFQNELSGISKKSENISRINTISRIL